MKETAVAHKGKRCHALFFLLFGNLPSQSLGSAVISATENGVKGFLSKEILRFCEIAIAGAECGGIDGKYSNPAVFIEINQRS